MLLRFGSSNGGSCFGDLTPWLNRRVSSERSGQFTSGLYLAGLGVSRPFVRITVDSDGVAASPNPSFLAWVGLPGFFVNWSDVEQIHELYGPFPDHMPFGGRHGVRLILRSRGRLSNRRGLARLHGPAARRPLLGLRARDVECLLAIAPPSIPRQTRPSLFWWL